MPVCSARLSSSLATQTLIFAVLAMSVDILAGFAGRTPLCHGAIFGASTYVVMYYVATAGGNPWLGVALGIARRARGSLVFALLAVRTTGRVFPAAHAGAGHDRLGRVPALDVR